MDFGPYIVEAALARTRGRVKGIYNRSEYLNERRDMMEAWAEWIESQKNKLIYETT